MENESNKKTSRSVLLVDDEPIVLDLVGKLLDKAGFDTLSAATGEEGIEIFRQHRNDIDCVLLDLALPDLDGAEIMDQIRRLDPDVPVIMSSGYGLEEMKSRFDENGPDGFLEKPYALAKLTAVLSAIKDR